MAAIPSATTIVDGIWGRFYTLINSITNPHSNGDKWIFGAEPDLEIIKRVNYPLIIINSPSVEILNHTFERRLARFTLTVDVFALSQKDLKQKIDSVINKIDSNKDSERGTYGLTMINVGGISSDTFLRDGIKVHMGSIIFSGEYRYDL